MVIMKNKTSYAILILIAISISVALTNTTLSRNSFFLSAILLVLYIIKFKGDKIEFPYIALSICILLISASQYVWLYRFSPTDITDSYNQYSETSLRLLVGSSLILFSSKIDMRLAKKSLTIILAIMIIGFIYTATYSVFKFIKHPENRLQINTVATMSAYVFLIQSLTTLSVIFYTEMPGKIKNTLTLLISSLSLAIISLTETRSALILFPILIIIFFYCLSKNKIKPRKSFLLLIPFFMVLLCFSGTLNRLGSSFQEISNYDKGKNDSSIGSRISMWKSGISAIEDHPFGQSAYTRFTSNTVYINSHEHGNPEALRNIKFHLHNDIIESSSLQGVFGGITLILFFFISSYICYREKNTAFFTFLILPTIILGLTDTLFIDYRFVTVLVQAIVIQLLLTKSEIKKNQEKS